MKDTHKPVLLQRRFLSLRGQPFVSFQLILEDTGLATCSDPPYYANTLLVFMRCAIANLLNSSARDQGISVANLVKIEIKLPPGYDPGSAEYKTAILSIYTMEANVSF